MGLCLFANNHVIDHEEARMIDQNKKPTAVSLAGVMRKGENGVGLLRFYKNVKYCILEAMHIDTDESNAAGLSGTVDGEVIL